MIAVSIVSHGHGAMVGKLIGQLLDCPEVGRIILTRNIPEALELPQDERIVVIDNPVPKGFGANHNAAFARCKEAFFCPLNPDIELLENPFPLLLDAAKRSGATVLAPLVLSPAGGIEDSIRHFPTLRSLFSKLLGGYDGRYHLEKGQADFCPDWVAGMFVLFTSEAYAKLKGFDEGFFLYYEDVDICVRAWQQGQKVLVCPRVSVVHDARRASRRNWQHFRWHLASMGRYFLKHWWRLPRAAA